MTHNQIDPPLPNCDPRLRMPPADDVCWPIIALAWIAGGATIYATWFGGLFG